MLSLGLRCSFLNSAFTGPPALSLGLRALFPTYLPVNRTALLPLLHNRKGLSYPFLSLHNPFISFFPLGLLSPWASSALSRPAVLSLGLWHSLLGSSVPGILVLSLGLRTLSRLLALPETCLVFCYWLCIYSKYYKVARLNNFSNAFLLHSLY